MSEKFSRRDFLKVAGTLGVVALAPSSSGCNVLTEEKPVRLPGVLEGNPPQFFKNESIDRIQDPVSKLYMHAEWKQPTEEYQGSEEIRLEAWGKEILVSKHPSENKIAIFSYHKGDLNSVKREGETLLSEGEVSTFWFCNQEGEKMVGPIFLKLKGDQLLYEKTLMGVVRKCPTKTEGLQG